MNAKLPLLPKQSKGLWIVTFVIPAPCSWLFQNMKCLEIRICGWVRTYYCWLAKCQIIHLSVFEGKLLRGWNLCFINITLSSNEPACDVNFTPSFCQKFPKNSVALTKHWSSGDRPTHHIEKEGSTDVSIREKANIYHNSVEIKQTIFTIITNKRLIIFDIYQRIRLVTSELSVRNQHTGSRLNNKRICGKVMFSQVSVILSTVDDVGYPWYQVLSWGRVSLVPCPFQG